jgi:hypothetical protein
MKFYMVILGSSLERKIEYPYLMMSSSHFFSKRTRKFTLTRYIPTRCESFFLDSGGFSLLSKWHNYPFSIWAYVELVKRIKPNLFASMDYPCEPTLEIVNRDSKLQMPVKERIKKTIENNENILNNYTYKSKFIPVIQGWELDDYKSCIDEMHNTHIYIVAILQRGHIIPLKTRMGRGYM